MGPSRSKGEAELQIDNDRMIVTMWTLQPKAETGWHCHEYDYLVVPLDDGELMIETTDKVFYNSVERGVSYFRDAGAEHNVVNNSAATYRFVEIEIR